MYDSAMIIVAYDIAESQRYSRQKLRRQLQRWRFTQVQKSVWQIKGNLPMGFNNTVSKIVPDDSIRVYFTDVKPSRL